MQLCRNFGRQTSMSERKALTSNQIDERLPELTGWTVERSAAATELFKLYKFGSFEAAIAFMQAAAPAISRADHHPRWENVYDRLSVRLTTHSLGNQLSELDFRVAHLLVEIYAQ